MPVFVNPKTVVPFVLRRQRELPVPADADDVEKARIAEENKVRAAERITFQIGIIPAGEFALLEDLAGADRTANGSADLRLCRGGLRGWEGQGCPAFVARGPSDPRPSDETLSCLHADDRHEIAGAILALHMLSGADAGKS